MRCVELGEFFHRDINFQDMEIFPEAWIKKHTFTQYKTTPRPCSALVFVCTDIHVHFYPKGENSMTAVKGDLVWIPTGKCYSVEVDGDTGNRIDTYTLNFRLRDGGEELLLAEDIRVLAREQDRLLETRIQAINNEKNLPPEQRNFLKIKSDFYALLDAIAGSAVENREKYYPIRVGVEALKREWNQNKKIGEYAAMCGVSSTYFYRCFREWAGKSPAEYRNMLRLSNAEAMLRHTHRKIHEISETVGFEDPFYFCHIFTRQFGMSPKSYRAKFKA